MVTASHNPPSYNGIKIKDHFGRPLPERETKRIEQLLPPTPLPVDPLTGQTISHQPSTQTGHEPVTVGSADFLSTYIRYLKQRIGRSLIRTLRGTVIVDAMHGVGAGLIDRCIGNSRLTIHTLHAARDPLFGGHRPEPVKEYLLDLQAAVKQQRALLGIALDGDADRVSFIEDGGRYLTPHQIFPLLIWYLAKEKGWKGKVVQAVSLGYLSERIARAYNLPFEEVPVGFKFVAERMLAEEVLAGGEESGGYGFRGGVPERDGVLCGLLFLEMLAATGQPLSLRRRLMERAFGRSFFLRRDFSLVTPIRDKTEFVSMIRDRLPSKLCGQIVREVRSLDGPKIILADDSWLLLRPSGTEPLLRTYAETSRLAQTQKLLKVARQLLGGMLSSP